MAHETKPNMTGREILDEFLKQQRRAGYQSPYMRNLKEMAEKYGFKIEDDREDQAQPIKEEEKNPEEEVVIRERTIIITDLEVALKSGRDTFVKTSGAEHDPVNHCYYLKVKRPTRIIKCREVTAKELESSPESDT
jgi:hypothetical protein